MENLLNSQKGHVPLLNAIKITRRIHRRPRCGCRYVGSVKQSEGQSCYWYMLLRISRLTKVRSMLFLMTI